MLGPVKILWIFIAGVGFYAGVMHLQIGLRRPIDRLHSIFGALVLCLALAVFGNLLLTVAQTPEQYQFAAWYSSTTVPLVFVILPWFLNIYAGNVDHRFAAALSAFYLVTLVGNFFYPYSMLLSAPPVLNSVTFPWGEVVTRSTTPSTGWFRLLWIGHGLTIVYVIGICTYVFLRGARAKAWALTLSAGPLAAGLFLNLLVMWGALRFPYLAAPGFLAMIFVMSFALTREWRRSHVQLQTLLDNVEAAVFLKDMKSRYLFVNKYFGELYNLAPDAALGKTDRQILDADRAALHALSDQEALAHGAHETEEIIDRNGAPRTYASARYALRDRAGDTYALCGIFTDVTERKAAIDVLRDASALLERRVARRTAELAQLNRELEAFAYSVSHDLRAPLTAINGFAELLLREHGTRLDQNGSRYLQRIRENSLRMAGLIQDLLGLSRVTQQAVVRQKLDLAELARESLRSLREAEPARAVDVVIPASLEATGDPKLLALAITNLISNAWKYTGKTQDARIELGTCKREGEPAFYVRDNGAGFNPEQADRLFRPFVRLHAESEFPGTGIGLATVARIVAKHGGRIWAEGKPHEGATFYFTLPTPEEDLAGSQDDSA